MADWRDFAKQEALRQGVDPSLVLPLIGQESSWNPSAVSPKGAAGFMQLMPGTAAQLGLSNADRFNPAKAIPAGVTYLKQQLDKYGDPAKALAAYNAGPGAVDRFGGVPPFKETQNYVRNNAMAAKTDLSADDLIQLAGGSAKGAKTLSVDDLVALAQSAKPAKAIPLKKPLQVIDNTKPLPADQELATLPWYQRAAIGAGKAGVDFLQGVGLADTLGLQSLPPARAQPKPTLSTLITGQPAPVSQQQAAANALSSDPAAVIGNLAGQVGITYAGGKLLGGYGQRMPGIAGQTLQATSRALTNPLTLREAAGGGLIAGALMQPGSAQERLNNALAGAAGGGAGQGVANLIAKAVKPVANQLGPEASRIADLARGMDITLTPAQQTGSKSLQILDAVLANLPFSGGKIQNLRAAQTQAINRATGKTFGADVKELSPQVIDDSFNRIGQEFSRLTSGKQIQLDNQFVNDLANVDALQSALPPSMRDAKTAGIVNDFLDLAGKGQIDGSVYQKTRSALSKQAKDAAASGNTTLKDSLQGLRDALDNAASRAMSPEDAQAWQLARQQYANLKTLTKGNVIDEAGNVLPGRLAQAVRSRNKDAYARGQAGDLNDIARVANQVVRQPIPDSGTAGRAAMQNLITGGALGAAPFSILPLAMLPVPRIIAGAVHSPAGQAYLTRGALAPNSPLIPIGQAIGARLPQLSAPLAAPFAATLGGLLGQ